MADEVQAGFLRAPRANDDGYGPIIVTGPAGASIGGGLTDTQLRASAVPVSAATLPLPAGAATQTTLAAVLAALASVAVTGPQTDAQARATPQPTAASPETSSVYNGSTALTPKFKLLNLAASSTNSTVVAAVTSKKIRVLAMVFVAGATATNITFNSATAGAISCLFANAANGGATLPFNPAGWFETVAGEALAATTGAGSTTGIQLTYVEV